jgi:hypothetical protein
MFISKAEKEELFFRVAMLEQTILGIKASLAYKPETRTRKGREWTPEQRKAQSDRMKKQQAQARAKKEKV